MSEPLMTVLAGLPMADSDSARADKTRIRCRARLARARATESSRAASERTRISLWQPVIITLAVAYIAEAIVLAIQAFATP